ncbi:FkbM family methyltransferase [Psychroserpens mesophilus]|uniref:FkbM family methyltransferase n=1 Tax=Psychroserpens mesophilus TaxID=325473 RepID=UPI003D65DF7D
MKFRNKVLLFLANTYQSLGIFKSFRKRLFSTKRILRKNYPKNSSFSFLQIGANDGKSFDFLYDFVVNRNISGALIEPIKEYFDELSENYKSYDNILKINKAVHRTATHVSIYKMDKNTIETYPDWVKGMASFDKNHLAKHDFIKEEDIIEEKVEAAPLMDIINDYNIKEFDYFQSDTEGYDYEIVTMFDFSKFHPKLVKAEVVNLSDEQKTTLEKLLLDNDYYVFYEDLDIVGIDLNQLKLQ